LETKNLSFEPHDPKHLLALFQSSEKYEDACGRRIADGVREFLKSASPDFITQLQNATAPDPWKIGFAILHKIDNAVIGMCGVTGPPDSDGVVEIGYSIAPSYEGKGYATEAANGLINFAGNDSRVKTIRAHTLAETTASTRVLEKCGFTKVSETVDPENNLRVWRWERPAESTSTS
jgi:ribosomal-protein-alanine N-acetyltransferase